MRRLTPLRRFSLFRSSVSSWTTYIVALCKQECGTIKQARHAKQECRVLRARNPVKMALMRATTSQCGLDSTMCHADAIAEVTKLDRPGFEKHGDSSDATLFCAATLHRFGLPFEYAELNPKTLPEMCASCKAPLGDPSIGGSRLYKIFAWQCHLGRCGGDGRRLWANEARKLAINDLVLSNPNPGE
jgi:hypothetical protein